MFSKMVFFYKWEPDDPCYVPVDYRDQDGVMLKDEWEEVVAAVDSFYSKPDVGHWIAKYNSVKSRKEREDKEKERREKQDEEYKKNKITTRGLKACKYFYVGRIKNATPETIIKIGIAKDESRFQYYIDQYGSNWELLGKWIIYNAMGFEKEVREKYKSKAITTGRDFFFLTDEETKHICCLAEEKSRRDDT